MNIVDKINTVGSVFVGGAKSQLKHDWVWATAAFVGLYQGLKYKGNLKNGVLAGVSVIAVSAVTTGLYNVYANVDKLKKMFNEADAG